MRAKIEEKKKVGNRGQGDYKFSTVETARAKTGTSALKISQEQTTFSTSLPRTFDKKEITIFFFTYSNNFSFSGARTYYNLATTLSLVNTYCSIDYTCTTRTGYRYLRARKSHRLPPYKKRPHAPKVSSSRLSKRFHTRTVRTHSHIVRLLSHISPSNTATPHQFVSPREGGGGVATVYV